MEDNLAQQLYATYKRTGVTMYRSAGEEIDRLRDENDKLRKTLLGVLLVIDNFPNDLGADFTQAVRAAAAALKESME